MIRALRQPGSPILLLLALLGLGGAGSLLLSGSTRVSPEDATRSELVGGETALPSGELQTEVALPHRAPVLEHRRGPRTPAEFPGRCSASPAPVPVKEREFLAAFLALERAQPGALETCARNVLESDDPPAEKVALLRALEESGSSAAARWLEHAVRTLPDDSGPHGEALPSFALDRLARLAGKDELPRAALARLAFEERDLAGSLRRRAAAAFAAVCSGPELDFLRVRLARETDELLVAGVLSALEPRSELPDVRRVLDEFSHGSGPERLATAEDGSFHAGHGSTRP